MTFQWKGMKNFMLATLCNSSCEFEENDYMEIQWGTTPLGGDLSIAYFFDKNDQHCTREDMAYMDIIIYNEDGTYLCKYGSWEKTLQITKSLNPHSLILGNYKWFCLR